MIWINVLTKSDCVDNQPPLDALRLLFKAVPVDHRNQHGCTLLWKAANHGKVTAVQCLIELGADANKVVPADMARLVLIKNAMSLQHLVRSGRYSEDGDVFGFLVDASRRIGPPHY